MKKIALLIAVLVSAVSGAMAQDAETKDSVYVVKDGAVVGAYEIADGDYITFTRPEADEWHIVKDSVKFYTTIYSYVNYSAIWQNGDKNEFAIENFLGTGTSLYYYIAPSDSATFNASDPTTWKGQFIPTSPVVESEAWGYPWYDFYTNSESYSFTDTTNNVVYDSFGFYGADYSIVDATYNYLYMFAYITIDNTTKSGYLYGVWK